jgi:hypothetical protein
MCDGSHHEWARWEEAGEDDDTGGRQQWRRWCRRCLVGEERTYLKGDLPSALDAKLRGVVLPRR